MNKRISILGCGWLGLALAVSLTNKGNKVYGSTTSISKLKILEEKNIKPFLIDISKPDVDMMDFLSSDVLIIAITSKSLEDVNNLISNIEKSKVKKILFISSTSVYPLTNGIVTEETNTAITPLSKIEKLFITNPSFKVTILRFGGLFGYDRKPGNFIKSNTAVKNPEGYINVIHRDDCIEIIEQIIIKNIWNEVLNACSDKHPKRRHFYLKEIKKVGKSTVLFDENSKNDFKIVSSEKMKTLLNYKFKYADFETYK
ncbi:MAG: NAD(P)-binding domain-containing protein [Algicola sp.]|nr:NAD(P)-binding domain-containing protein [Algicola sp.]